MTGLAVGVVVGRIGDLLEGELEGKRSAMRCAAKRATGKVASIKPYLAARRYKGFLRKIKSRTGSCPIYGMLNLSNK